MWVSFWIYLILWTSCPNTWKKTVFTNIKQKPCELRSVCGSVEKSWSVSMLRMDSLLQSQSDLLSAPSGHQMSTVIYNLNSNIPVEDDPEPIEFLTYSWLFTAPQRVFLWAFCFTPFKLINKHHKPEKHLLIISLFDSFGSQSVQYSYLYRSQYPGMFSIVISESHILSDIFLK